MNRVLAYACFGILSYLLGAIPFGLLISRAKGIDIRSQGSGNIGATNVFRTMGKGFGILTFFCDAAKGFLPAFLFPWLSEHILSLPNSPWTGIVCGFLAVAGHNWPIYLRFKGGKGIATSAGMLLGVAWQAILIGLAVWILVFLFSRYVSAASISAALAIAIASWLLYAQQSLVTPIALTVLASLAVLRHKTNIQRLLQGNENRFEFRKGKETS